MITDGFEFISAIFYCAFYLSFLFYDIYYIFLSCYYFEQIINSMNYHKVK